ncbi:Amine sulfotransferase [Holothuria leucospilota]|uniref:Amine sulfotransferase n=1 Tax=Holothuria leucospilota TaxID=206669 RepID=A0A9Q1BTW9_HOLLE|nr:Amine sulfotransferase [Holothuria leucospilota]
MSKSDEIVNYKIYYNYSEKYRLPLLVPPSVIDELSNMDVRSDDIFICTYPKSGFLLDSQNMIIRPKPERVSKSLDEIRKFKSKQRKTLRELAHIIGLLVSLFPGVQYGPLHYRNMEMLKVKLLKHHRGDYDAEIYVSENDLEELVWWQENLTTASHRFLEDDPDIILETDASQQGWGGYSPTFSTKAQGKFAGNLRVVAKSVTKFIGRSTLAEETMQKVLENATLPAMKKNFEELEKQHRKANHIDVRVFLGKGTSGRWKDYFSVRQSEDFDEIYRSKMKDCSITKIYDI